MPQEKHNPLISLSLKQESRAKANNKFVLACGSQRRLSWASLELSENAVMGLVTRADSSNHANDPASDFYF